MPPLFLGIKTIGLVKAEQKSRITPALFKLKHLLPSYHNL